MNRRPGHVDVMVETGYCSFCGRPRNLRREEHHLGALVRTIVTCETCHRTLSSSIGVAQAESSQAEETETAEVGAEPATAAKPTADAAKTPAKSATAKPATKKPAAKRAAATKPAAKKTAKGGKPTSTATRKVTRKKP